MNLPLKLAILRTGRSQRQISASTDIAENRLSAIVRGWTQARVDERAALARVLEADEDVLFSEESVVEIRAAR